MKKAFYVPNQPWIIDDVRERADGVLVSALGGRTFLQIQEQYPGATIIPLETAINAIEALCKTVPRPIAAHDFYYAKTALQNYGRECNGEMETFKMTEHKNGRITAIYACIHFTYWTFDDDAGMTHDEIIDRCMKCLP